MSNVLVAPTEAAVANAAGIQKTISMHISPATQKAYAQQMKTLLAFYKENGWEFLPLLENGELNESRFLEQVLSYLQNRFDEGRTLSTMIKTLSAVKHFTSYENQRAFSSLFLLPVKAFMEGMARQTKDYDPKKAEAFTLPQLEKLYASFDPTNGRDRRDKALIAMGIATALRSSSLGELKLKDISYFTKKDGLEGINVHLRFSKTDQHGAGVYIPVGRSPRKLLDPVGAFYAWLSVLDHEYGITPATDPDFPLFPTIRGRERVMPSAMAHSSIAVTEMLRKRLVDAEMFTEAEAQRYSSHSLRATFITLSNAAHVPEKDIAVISGHKNMNSLRGYDRNGAVSSAQVDYLNG
jgi:integrase